MTKLRVVVADDHETVRQGLILLIDSQSDMHVVGEAGDGHGVVDRVRELTPDVAVVDISMPRMNGLAATQEIRRSLPDTAIVALTRFADDAYVKEMLKAGVGAYVLKQSASATLIEAIRAVAGGRQYLDGNLDTVAGGALMKARHGQSPYPTTTDREADVLRMMALGHSNKEIASALDISVKTVEVHKANGMRKLGLHGRIDVVKYAVLQGWLNDA